MWKREGSRGGVACVNQSAEVEIKGADGGYIGLRSVRDSLNSFRLQGPGGVDRGPYFHKTM